MKTIRSTAAAALAAACTFSLPAAQAQQPGIQRTEVQRHDLGIPGRELVQVRVDFAPGATFPRHSHPGEEVAYVLEGSVEYQLDGQAAVTLKKGESLFIPARAIHTARNAGSGNAIEMATYIVETGKPALELAR
jgi:quercetin dioxygenase-like cupin family protein